MRPQDQRYTNVAVALHWLIGLAILAMLVMGFTMTKFLHTPGWQATGFKLFQLHKSIGISILILAVLRLLWRLTHRAPPLPAHMPAHERIAAEGVHVLLYALMIGMPLVGWAYVSASPFTVPTVLFGLVPWPHLEFLATLPADAKKAVAPVLAAIHDYGAWTLAAFIALHIAGALKHYLIDRDTTLQRMIPGLPRLGAPRQGHEP